MTQAIYTNEDEGEEGSLVTVVSTNGGWTTIKSGEYGEMKVRNGTLTFDNHPDFVEMKAAIEGEEEADNDEADEDDINDGLRRIKKAKYDPSTYVKAKSVNGHNTLHCGDDIAVMLNGLSLDECYNYVAALTLVTEQILRERYTHLNLGMQRMNLGNKIRAFRKAQLG